MGRGNFYPNTERDHRMVYIDRDDYDDAYDEETGEYDVDAGQWRYEDLKMNIISQLPDSFEAPYRERWEHDMYVLAENGLFTVGLKEEDTYTALAVWPHEDAPAFADARLDQTVSRFFGKPKDLYTLRVRNGAWTSGLYEHIGQA